MVRVERWQRNRLVVSPPGAVHYDVPASRARRRALVREVAALPLGTPVALAASAPGARRRCRSFGARAGVRLEREFLAFPSAGAPGCLVEDAPASVRALVATAPLVPPRNVLSVLVDLGARGVRALRPWRTIRALSPGRVVVGVRA